MIEMLTINPPLLDFNQFRATRRESIVHNTQLGSANLSVSCRMMKLRTNRQWSAIEQVRNSQPK
jgi:hypothetical protein